MADDIKKKTNYKSLHKKISSRVSSAFSSEQGNSVVEQLKSGTNHYLKYERVINTSFDNSWIKAIEDCLYDLGTIIQNPKRVTKEVTDVVPVELARKTNAQSITHLSTHSQFVKEMLPNGDVVPNKILNIGSDDFYQTYENRFIATLIRKLVLFVEKRYQFLQQHVEIKRSKVLVVKNKSIIDGREVEIETKVKISDEDVDEGMLDANRTFINRVLEVKRYLLYYYNSSFMQLMHTEKNVRNPIIMTNIIRKNPAYNHCYNLYKFIEKYDMLGVDFKVNDKYDQFNEDELDELNNMMAANFMAISPSETIDKSKNKRKKYSPHIVTSLDDDKFVYGPYFKGPLEFVRADERYLTYLDALKKPTPVHPTKAERAFYGDELALNQEVKDELKEIAALLSRKKKEAKETNKEFDKVVEDREQETANYYAVQAKMAEDNLLDKIEKAREDLINQALPNEEAKDTIKANPFDKLKNHVSLDFIEKIDKSEPYLIDAYNEIRHAAICYGLHSRISKKCEAFRLHNTTYVKITAVGKCLKVHYALNPKDYEYSPIPVIDDGNKKAYEETPLTLKVKSGLSIKRARLLLDDLAKKFNLTYVETEVEPIKPSTINSENIEDEVEETETNTVETPVSPFANLAKKDFVPFATRLKNAKQDTKEAYQEIKDHILDYQVHDFVSKKGENFRSHAKTLIQIKIVGKSLILHFALDPKDYKDSPIPTKDYSSKKAYENIPLYFKVTSGLAIKRAIKLVDDVMAKNNVEKVPEDFVKPSVYEVFKKDETKKEAPKAEIPANTAPIQNAEEIEEKFDEAVSESAATPTEVKVETPVEVPAAPVNPFAKLANIEILPFDQRLEKADDEVKNAYKEIKGRVTAYGVKGHISKKGEAFRAHAKTFVLIKIVGKSLVVHYALDPKDYVDSKIPFKDNSGKSAYSDIPLTLKITSELALRRAVSLVDDVMNKNGYYYFAEEVEDEENEEVVEPKEGKVEANKAEEKPVVIETPVEVPVPVANPFSKLANIEILSFEERLDKIDDETKKEYEEIKSRITAYGIKGFTSKKGESFRLHNKTYLVIKIVGKSLVLHFALDPKDYVDSKIPFKDNSAKAMYAEVPFCFKVTSELAFRRALSLVDDVMNKNGFYYFAEGQDDDEQ